MAGLRLDTREGAFAKVIVPGKPLLQMADFNGLIALSQKHQAPVFDLTDQQLEQSGVVLDRTKKSMEEFRRLYSEGADKIIAMTTNASGT